jgi:hypothetical protein
MNAASSNSPLTVATLHWPHVFLPLLEGIIVKKCLHAWRLKARIRCASGAPGIGCWHTFSRNSAQSPQSSYIKSHVTKVKSQLVRAWYRRCTFYRRQFRRCDERLFPKYHWLLSSFDFEESWRIRNTAERREIVYVSLEFLELFALPSTVIEYDLLEKPQPASLTVIELRGFV